MYYSVYSNPRRATLSHTSSCLVSAAKIECSPPPPPPPHRQSTMLSPLRTTLRTTLRTRCYSTPAAAPAASSTSTAAANAAKASAFSEEREAIRHHAAKSGALWRKITCVTSCLLVRGEGGREGRGEGPGCAGRVHTPWSGSGDTSGARWECAQCTARRRAVQRGRTGDGANVPFSLLMAAGSTLLSLLVSFCGRIGWDWV